MSGERLQDHWSSGLQFSVEKYHTMIDLNEVDIRIYLAVKSYILHGRKAEVNITFVGT